MTKPLHRISWSLVTTLSLTFPAHAAESDRVAPTGLNFLPNGTLDARGVVLAGETLSISYDPLRLGQCRGANWNVQAYLAIDGEAPLLLDLIAGRETSFPYAVPVEVVMPAGRNLEIWFKGSDSSGCVQWDSNRNQNYEFAIYRLDQIPSLHFYDNWQITQQGVLQAGQPVRLHYDLGRATQCRTGGYHGSASWDVTPQLRVEGRRVAAQSLTYAKSWSERGQQDIVVLLPQGKDLTLWFENSGYEYYAGRSCMAYDSNYGKNYVFPLN